MFGWLFNNSKREAPIRPVPRVIRATYDAAQTSHNTRRHWQGADDLSAKAANSPAVRRVLRNRSRYETANNCYARGIAKTLANDVIGTGPRLQILLEDEDANTTIERQFQAWSKEIRFARKLRTCRKGLWNDGEAFMVLTTNPKHKKTPVQLDVRLQEADRCATPDLLQDISGAVDGIVFDEFGNPVEYHFLREHPGDKSGLAQHRYDRVSADFVIHLFDPDRAEQCRAVPESTVSLNVFGRLRDFTVAVVDAAKQAATFAGVLQTTLPPNGETDDLAPEEVLEPELNTLVAAPAGWTLNQLKAEQPTTGFGDFKGENLDEVGRSVSMPSNVVRGNSSAYNYASGRLDTQVYYKAIAVEQDDLFTLDALDRVLDAFFEEASKIPGFMPFSLEELLAAPHQWIWPGTEHVDPSKESNADEIDLRNGTVTRQMLAQKKHGMDWKTQIAPGLEEENAIMRRIALPSPGAPAPTNSPAADPAEEEVAADG